MLAVTSKSLVLTEVKGGCPLGYLRGNDNHLLFMNDLKMYGQNKNQIDTLGNIEQIFSEHTEMECRISKCGTLLLGIAYYKRYLYSEFNRKADKVSTWETWNLLKTRLLKKEGEVMLIAAQEQALRKKQHRGSS